ncbi:MAG TPA: DCC1-like thiol-disulfide oxidoreductase family protein [Bacillota bacterium]|nr:DCC1-like thiol-disulfide oxidoreductase family protein [Bacillota bacterium]
MESIILFDGDCHFCNKSVQFIIKRDPKAIFSFAPLQGPTGERLKKEYELPSSSDSFILIENGHMYEESTAALRVAKQLKGMWKLSYVGIIIPKPIRNGVYRIIANNRRKLLRKEGPCPIPTPEMKNRMLE